MPPLRILRIGFIAALLILCLCPAFNALLFVPVGYWILALVVTGGAPTRDPRYGQSFLAVFSLFYGLFFAFSGAFLPTVLRVEFLLVAPALYLVLLRDRSLHQTPTAYLFFSVTAPALLLAVWTVREDIGIPGLAASLFTAAAGGFGLVCLLRRSIQDRKLALSLIGVAAAALFFFQQNVVAAASGQHTERTTPLRHEPLKTETGATVTVADYAGSVVVLDFWYTGCSVCFKKFPEFQRLAASYTGRPAVFAAVNVPTETEAFRRLGNNGRLATYRFAKWVAARGATDRNAWGIEAYPTMLIFDKKGRLRYRGSLFTGPHYVVNNAKQIIETLLAE